MLRYILLCCITASFCLPSRAQQLLPGQMMPDITIKNIFNDTRDSIKFSNLKGKLVILDFWSTACHACIASLPRLDFLQQKFKDKIQLLLVSDESKSRIEQFFKVRKRLVLPRIPFATFDSALHKFFPHEGKPYTVWIDTSGKILHTTEGYNVAEWSIGQYFAGKKPNLTAVAERKYIHSFIGEQWKPSMLYYSYITKIIPGIRLDAGEKVEGFMQFSRWNASVVELYKEAFSENARYDFEKPGRLELKIKNLFPYVSPEHADSSYNYWLQNYCYNYHLLWPEEKKEQFYKTMQLDLQRFFGLHAKVVQKKVNGLALIRTAKEDKLKTKGGPPFINLHVMDMRSVDPGPVRRLVNQPFKEFTERIETVVEYVLKQPFSNEVHYEGNIDFEINGDVWDQISLPQLRQQLRKYGLDLIEKPTVIPVLVISE